MRQFGMITEDGTCNKKLMDMDKLVKTSYKKEDVVVLLKNLSDCMKELPTEEREKLIQSGVHYSEMLPQEKAPSAEYEALYEKALANKKLEIANDIAVVSEMILDESLYREMGHVPVIISLARAGLPVGILIKRYLKYKYNIDCPHYGISIIRDKGIDKNAMEYIYKTECIEHGNSVMNMFFVDGWTGKGVIDQQVKEAVADLAKEDSKKWGMLSDELYVLADPANILEGCGTHEDYLLPSACLNSTVSGLTSRTILNQHINVEDGDFHGAVYFNKFEDIDKSNEFIDTVSNEFHHTEEVTVDKINSMKPEEGWTGMSIVQDICKLMNVPDYKKVKPGIGETTRVLLRRVPWKVLINKDISEDDPDIQHILVLCREKKIPTMRWDLGHYKVCGIIKELSADA